MSSNRRWRLVVPGLLALALVACGRTASPQSVRAGSPTPSASTPSASTPTGSGSGSAHGSTVAGLTPDQLRAAVLAPGTTRRVAGPTAEPVTVAGRTVWRIRIPGRFAPRDARAVVSVGARRIGFAIEAPDLGSLVAVTTDPAGLVAGAPVSFRWEGSSAVAAGRLEVVR